MILTGGFFVRRISGGGYSTGTALTDCLADLAAEPQRVDSQETVGKSVSSEGVNNRKMAGNALTETSFRPKREWKVGKTLKRWVENVTPMSGYGTSLLARSRERNWKSI
jgi:hypothetical protein